MAFALMKILRRCVIECFCVLDPMNGYALQKP